MTLAELRTDLVETLDTLSGVQVSDSLPRQIHPPSILAEPGAPYITDDGDDVPYGHVRVSYVLYLVGRRAEPSVQTVELDNLVERTLIALTGTIWDLGEVTQPASLSFGPVAYLATTLTVSTVTRLI